jgi:FAD/FMN-containing dehydrogenase
LADADAPWGALRGAIAGEVALAGSAAHARAGTTFNARYHGVRPRAVVSCATPEDVAATIAFARRHGIAVAVRSGGHSFAGHSSTRGLLIDVSPMRSITVSDGVATVGAGARLGDVYEALDRHGLAIPGGTCPSVGIAGLTLGGGLGILGRTYGVTSDWLAGADVVLADGRMVRCDERRHPELFWALRGGGAGTLGVVTSLELHPVPAPDATNVHLSWPFARAADVVEAWQRWAPDGPDELAASLKLTTTADPDDAPAVDVYGAILAGGSDASALVDDLVAAVGSAPASSWSERLSFPETRAFWARLGQESTPVPGEPQSEAMVLFARSEFFSRPLPAGAVGGLLDALSSRRRPGEGRELDLMPWGGAYNRVPADATAFVHRDQRFQIKHAAVVEPGASDTARASARRQVDRSWRSVHPWASGRVFQNFADPELGQWEDAYFGSNLTRLREVKARYDPEDLFRIDAAIARTS